MTDLSPDTAARLGKASTATLAEQLRHRGYGNAFIPGLRATRPDLRLLGRAHTLRYLPARPDMTAGSGPYDPRVNAQRRTVESIEPGEVLVIDARGRVDAGVLGDILTARVLARGGAGIVTDGALRDTPGITEVDLPVYHRASHGLASIAIHFPFESQVPIACGEVLVVPGDVLVGDAEGVVVIPAALTGELAAAAEEAEEAEAFAAERVRAGDPLTGTYPLAEARRAEFEAWRAARRSGR